MRKKILTAVSLLLCVVMLSLVNFRPVTVAPETDDKNQTQVVTLSSNNSVENKALETRFLNMLNHNFVYNDDFSDDESLVNNSLLALLSLAEDSYVEKQYVEDYIFNMYGIENLNYENLSEELTQKDGFLYILPRGYSLYEHKIVSITENLDGSYTVITDVEISLDDGTYASERATTLFFVNNESQFGFNILYSDISLQSSDAKAC